MKSVILVSILLALAPIAVMAQYCQNQASEAAVAVDKASFPQRSVNSVVAEFVEYTGHHQKAYNVGLSYDRQYQDPSGKSVNQKNYQVKVFEFENESGYPCSIDEVLAK